jgi:hypothetical protein
MALKDTFREILPLHVYFVAADLRSGQTVREQKVLYRAAIVTGPGEEPGTVDLYVLPWGRGGACRFDGEQENVKLLQTARLEDWTPGREFCCVELLPPHEGQALATTIPQPPPRETFRQRKDKELEQQAPEPEESPEEPEDEPKAPKPPRGKAAKKAAKKAAGRAAAAAGDMEPLNFEVPDAGGVVRSRDRLDPNPRRGQGPPRKPADAV